MSCNHNCCSSVDNQRLIWRSDSGLERERSLFLPQKLTPFRWIQMEMPERQSWARSSAAQGTENPTLRRIEPLPPLCKGGRKKKAHLSKVTGLALNSARLKAPFKGTALNFQWSCFAIQLLLFYRWKRKNSPSPAHRRFLCCSHFHPLWCWWGASLL